MNRVFLYVTVILLCSVRAFSDVVANGPFAGLDLSAVKSEYRSAIVRAGEDCLEVESLRLPKYAKPVQLEELDGGTRTFIGDGYLIVVRHTLFLFTESGQKIEGYSYGYELYLGPSDLLEKYPATRPVASKVWFLPNARKQVLERADQVEKKPKSEGRQPAPPSVTPRADARSAPAGGAEHL